MTLIKNKNFLRIFEGHEYLENYDKSSLNHHPNSQKCSSNMPLYDPRRYPYIGMGNPDSKLLLVGAEKKIDSSLNPAIYQHELVFNFLHWLDIVTNHQNLKDQLHPKLKLRNGLKGHNPFSPLTLDETCNDVYCTPVHTYKKIEKLIQPLLGFPIPPPDIFQISPKKYIQSVFNYCFVTELSDDPLVNHNGIEDFDFPTILKSNSRIENARNGRLSDFYRSFEKVVIYAGREFYSYARTDLRLAVINIFNPLLTHNDLIDTQNIGNGKWLFDKYQSPRGGAIVIVCKHLIRVNEDQDLQHLLGTMGIGHII